MPWKIVPEGGQFCVHKLNADGSVGAQVACHDTEGKAKAQLAALYVNEPQARSAMPDGTYDIEKPEDIPAAIARFIEEAAQKAPARVNAVRRHIMRRAREIGGIEALPGEWRSAGSLAEAIADLPENDLDAPQMRSAHATEVEIKSDGKTFVGYAAVFDIDARLADGLTESVQRGAFRKVGQQRENIPFLYDHQGVPFATTAAGTLRLGEDTKGFHVEADLPEHHPHVRMLREQVERGEVAGMSWGFKAGRGNASIEVRGNTIHRTLSGFEQILDVSPTWDPAYTQTDAEIRRLRYNFLAGSPDLIQQILSGAAPQRDGAGDEDPDAQTDPVTEEQRSSGAAEKSIEEIEAEAAARSRRLMIARMQLPEEFRK